MRNVLYLVAFAETDDVPEIILNDAEVIAVIVDVRRQEKCVATPHDALLAQIGRTPVDFQTQLVRLHDFWRLGKAFPKLREERHVAVRRSLVIDERGVGDLTGSALCCPLHERGGARVVPYLLRVSLARRENQCEERNRSASRGGTR